MNAYCPINISFLKSVFICWDEVNKSHSPLFFLIDRIEIYNTNKKGFVTNEEKKSAEFFWNSNLLTNLVTIPSLC